MRPANAALTGGSLVAALLVAISLGTSTTEPVLAQAGTRGTWRTATTTVPINPVHAALMRNGEVLIVAVREMLPPDQLSSDGLGSSD